MSGIELIGLAASVLQIADLGWKSSYKLYAFSRKVHEAGKTIELISQDIAATGAILHQLGDELKKDEEAKPESRLCSKGLVDAATKLVQECKEIFKEIDSGIAGGEGNKVILGFKQKLKWSYLEPRVELLRTNLERLKSSLAIMLNVLIYAEQRRSRQAQSVLTEQQDLVASFARQQADSEKRIQELQRSLEYQFPPSYQPNLGEEVIQSDQSATLPPKDERMQVQSRFGAENQVITTSFIADKTAATRDISSMQVSAVEPGGIRRFAAITRLESRQPESLNSSSEFVCAVGYRHVPEHRPLIEKMLEEVNRSDYAVEHGVRYSMDDQILRLHWQDWSPQRSTHPEKLLEILSAERVLARSWQRRKSTENITRNPRPDVHKASINDRTYASAAYEEEKRLQAFIDADMSHNASSTSLRARSSRGDTDVATPKHLEPEIPETIAEQPEEGGRIHGRSRDNALGISPIPQASEHGASKSKILDQPRSMFHVHVQNPKKDQNSAAKQPRGKDPASPSSSIVIPQKERASGAEAPQSGTFSRHQTNRPLPNKPNPPITSIPSRQMPQSATLIERSRYHFETDSEDDELEDEINENLASLSGAAARLNILARTTGLEVEARNSDLRRISEKSDRLDASLSFAQARPLSVADSLLNQWTTLSVEPPPTMQARLNRIR